MTLERELRYDLWVAGDPVAQPRPKAQVVTTMRGKRVQVRGGPVVVDRVHAHIYTPNSARAWRDAVAGMALANRAGQSVLTGPVSVFATCYFKRPKYMRAKKYPRDLIPHTKRPDQDNLAKALLDALGDAGIWGDDSQVFEFRIQKWYTSSDGASGVRLKVYETDALGGGELKL